LAKPAWGLKRSCQSCGVRFYDLLRDPIVCPKCATVYDRDAAQRTRRSRAPAAAKPVVVRAPVRPLVDLPEAVEPVVGDEELEPVAEEAAEDVIEDTEDLPEDATEVTEVIESVEGEEEA